MTRSVPTVNTKVSWTCVHEIASKSPNRILVASPANFVDRLRKRFPSPMVSANTVPTPTSHPRGRPVTPTEFVTENAQGNASTRRKNGQSYEEVQIEEYRPGGSGETDMRQRMAGKRQPTPQNKIS